MRSFALGEITGPLKRKAFEMVARSIRCNLQVSTLFKPAVDVEFLGALNEVREECLSLADEEGCNKLSIGNRALVSSTYRPK